ncbi:MAG: membrane protein insertion efficiency factor YidD [Ruminococcus sp.]|nr:membrane protein insertion efficiency factor YidD [Ruminococcus sp.]
MKELLILLIKFYKRFISSNLPPRCRYYPSCSSYAMEAVGKHGALKGTLLAAGRILRCNPFSRGGVDKVPDSFDLYRYFCGRPYEEIRYRCKGREQNKTTEE